MVFLKNSSVEEEQQSESSSEEESEKPAKRRRTSDRKAEMLYLQMEYCEGATLFSYIKSNAIISPEERWRLFRQTLEALAYLHGRGLVHRDLKPSNIFLTKDNDIKLGDFGLTVTTVTKKPPESGEDPSSTSPAPVSGGPMMNTEPEESSGQTAPGAGEGAGGNAGEAGVGTPFYRSPEQERGETPTDKSDIYSLGIILFEMCYPFETFMERTQVILALRSQRRFPPAFDAQVIGAREVKELVLQCLKEQPADRPSAIELLQR